jgi:hypothetical protein
MQKGRNGPWFRFGPSSIISMTVEFVSKERFIRRDEWDEIRAFVCGVSRTPLVRTLLAGAEALEADGQRRSALTEAITALEVALYEFARHPNAERAFGPLLAERISASSLLHQVKHMGLTGSVSYLLPVILTEADLPKGVVQGSASTAQRQALCITASAMLMPTLCGRLSAIRRQ